ncbi:MAG: phospho-sugar mutase [Bacteroidales bacterium]|nr:phospho-sugar mutase [Bacteroidales bacterium]MCF8386960.1 phospho-sugar mutase [Bacteroidales bacterium]MCF8398570.1 phospho-sugar mutase [Bacteroidales bacterium]
MSKVNIDKEVLQKANKWLEGNYDEDTKNRIREMMQNEQQELVESFYRDLEFGTGGLRGIMGVGSNRMNKYTVGMATQGLANYLKARFSKLNKISVAVACDSRNNSHYFAKVTAEVFSANDIFVYLFEDLRPTPELSFAIRHFKCQSGVVITASHNPKEYNGYKAYWDDGGQLISPHDKNVIAEVQKIQDIDDVRFNGRPENIHLVGTEIDKEYLAEIKKLSLSPELIQKHKDLKIVYTPLHGTGYKLVPMALEEFGFENVALVEQQDIPDGNFPTVKSPNPEEAAALQRALEKARKIDADLVMATDPDADRVGIAVKNPENEFVLLNGNQTASILTYYLLTKWKENKKLDGKQFIVKTIVTSELLNDIARKYDVESFDVLTGFKFIADKIKAFEGEKEFIGGGEESYGFMIGDFVRDKDAVASCAMIAETTAWAIEQGKSLFSLLIDIYLEFGFYKEKLVSVIRKGKAGAEEIQEMMENFRENPPLEINHSKVVLIKDYLKGIAKDIQNGKEEKIDLPKSNVLQFFTADGTKISMRPSGTEPKIKFYFGVKEEIHAAEEYNEMNERLEKRINAVIDDLSLDA